MKGKRIVITGAASGIGKAFAELIASEENKLVLIDINKEGLYETFLNCQSKGCSNIIQFHIDLAELDKLESLPSLVEDLGSEEIVFVSIAGSNAPGPLLEREWSELEKLINVNLLAPMRTIHLLMPLMLKQGTGQIIALSSIAAKYIFSTSAAYCASKAGLLTFTRTICEEFRDKGIRVCNVLPGNVDTPLWDKHQFSPPKEEMLTAISVAEQLRDLVNMPKDRSIDCLELMPPKGMLKRNVLMPST